MVLLVLCMNLTPVVFGFRRVPKSKLGRGMGCSSETAGRLGRGNPSGKSLKLNPDFSVEDGCDGRRVTEVGGE